MTPANVAGAWIRYRLQSSDATIALPALCKLLLLNPHWGCTICPVSTKGNDHGASRTLAGWIRIVMRLIGFKSAVLGMCVLFWAKDGWAVATTVCQLQP